MRPSRRQPDELRAVSLERGVVKYAEGSCFVKFGDTHVLVTATLEDRLPPWLKGQARGWVTAEYGMLPRATHERTRREASAGKQSGRTVEIQRLIGRSLRSVVDLPALGERQITIDCDVIQADGGTRTASITGAWVALHDCIAWMRTREMIKDDPLRDHVAAISCGVCNGVAVLDLDYAEDSEAETDANFVMTGVGNIVEVQATAEKTPFSEEQFLRVAGAGAQRHRQARRSAEDGGDVSAMPHRPHRRPSRRSRPTIRASSPRCATCWRLTASTPYRPANSACPSRRRPARPSAPTPASRRRPRPRRRTCRRSPTIPASRSTRSTASPASIRRAGPGRTRIFAAPWSKIESLLIERGAKSRGSAGAHFVSALCVAWPDGHVEEFEATRRRHAGLAAARRPGLRLRSDVPAGRT